MTITHALDRPAFRPRCRVWFQAKSTLRFCGTTGLMVCIVQSCAKHVTGASCCNMPVLAHVMVQARDDIQLSSLHITLTLHIPRHPFRTTQTFSMHPNSLPHAVSKPWNMTDITLYRTHHPRVPTSTPSQRKTVAMPKPLSCPCHAHVSTMTTSCAHLPSIHPLDFNAP